MEEKKLFPSVFGWMFVGLLVTFLTGFYVSNNVNMIYNIINNMWLIILVEFALVIILSIRAYKMNYMTSIILFVLYSFVTGLTFSSIFIVYEMSSIISLFLVSAIIFGLFSLLGYKTRLDLTKFSTILYMILLGGIVVTIVNLFLNNSMIEIVVSWVILIVFFGITAYDIQKIKRISYQIQDPKRVTIICALDLYLDFINIFLRILSLFGKSRD
ncbi:MAG: Bax inhibitor-1/YccA family protein [Firmicutes bacterium]|nr:Bax inhibitor-1/YccA family protein [Bacillota bacterium]